MNIENEILMDAEDDTTGVDDVEQEYDADVEVTNLDDADMIEIEEENVGEEVEAEIEAEPTELDTEDIEDGDVELLFDEFLKKYKLSKEESEKRVKTISHTCYGQPWGSYNIPDNEYDTFLNLYKRVFGKRDLHVIERNKKVGPLLIDIDFRLDKKYRERQYLISNVFKLVGIINELVTKYLNVSRDEIEYFVFEKSQPTFDTKQNNYKDGFHIVLPLPIDVKMRYFILLEAKRQAVERKIFVNIPFTNNVDDVFDVTVVLNNGWLMYGSRKHDGHLYKLSHIYDSYTQEKSLDIYEHDELVVHMAIRKYGDDDGLELKSFYKTDNEFNKGVDDIYSKFHNDKRKSDIKQIKVNENLDKMAKYGNNVLRARGKKEDIQMAKELVKLLSPERASPYSDWIHVCWALHNIDNCLLEDFIEFSKKCPAKYQAGCCEKVWYSAKDNGLTIASLYMWAKTDNPEGYAQTLRNNIKNIIREAETGTHDDIAKVVYEMYKHVFRCVSIKKNIWYEFQGHRWVLVDSGYTLANKLSDELTKEFSFLASEYFSKAATSHGIEKDSLFSKGKTITKLIDKLKNQSFKNSVIVACSHRFHANDFEETLDDNKDLIGFENGVFDLKNDCFRPGLPDDKLTLSTGYDYVEYDKDSEEVKEAEEYFRQVQLDPEMRKYVMLLLASFLDGHNKNQKFILWTGSGCHAPDTEIVMFDGTRKKVQNINLNDLLMGDDGQARQVRTLFRGEQDMYRIHLDNGDSFVVNKNHRLALKNTFTNNIRYGLDIYDNEAYYVEWYEYIENIPILKSRTFKTVEDAKIYLNEQIKTNADYIDYGEVVSVQVVDYIELDGAIKQYFKMYNNKIEIDVKNKLDGYQYALKNDYKKIK